MEYHGISWSSGDMCHRILVIVRIDVGMWENRALFRDSSEKHLGR